MKRVKFMLTAITVLAVVGGALAFKAQRFSMPKICSGTVLNQCQILASTSTTTTTGTESFYYTEVPSNVTNCGTRNCDIQTYLKAE